MKRILSLTVMAAILSSSAFAQQNRDTKKDDRPGKHMRSGTMKDELGLSAAQKEQMKNLNEKYKSQHEAIRNNASLTQDQKKEQMKDLREKQQTEMKALLTTEQRTKWEAQKEKREQQWKDRKKDKAVGTNKGFHNGEKGNKGVMMDDMNLTTDQQSKIKGLREERFTKMKAIKENSSLTETQKRDQLKALNDDIQKRQKAILTPDQQKKWDEKMDKRKSMKNRR